MSNSLLDSNRRDLDQIQLLFPQLVIGRARCKRFIDRMSELQSGLELTRKTRGQLTTTNEFACAIMRDQLTDVLELCKNYVEIRWIEWWWGHGSDDRAWQGVNRSFERSVAYSRLKFSSKVDFTEEITNIRDQKEDENSVIQLFADLCKEFQASVLESHKPLSKDQAELFRIWKDEPKPLHGQTLPEILADSIQEITRICERIEFQNSAQNGALKPIIPYHLLLEPTKIVNVRELGTSMVGVCFQAKMGAHIVAVKHTSSGILSQDVYDNLIIELLSQSLTRHPNIINILGLVSADNLSIVYEWAEHQSLYDVINVNKTPLPWFERVDITMQVIQGLKYLHQSSFLFHGQLKSSNVLLKGRWQVKLADFGLIRVRKELSRLERKKKSSKEPKDDVGSGYGWQAPEVLRMGSLAASPKSDVFSLGILMWELTSGKIPHAGLDKEEIKKAYARGIVLQYPVGSLSDAPDNWKETIDLCWTFDPDFRSPLLPIEIQMRAIHSKADFQRRNQEYAYHEAVDHFSQKLYDDTIQSALGCISKQNDYLPIHLLLRVLFMTRPKLAEPFGGLINYQSDFTQRIMGAPKGVRVQAKNVLKRDHDFALSTIAAGNVPSSKDLLQISLYACHLELVEGNMRDSIEILRIACRHGYPLAHHLLGLQCLDDTNASPAYAQAAEHFAIAVRAGIVSSLSHLAFCLFHGHGVPVDRLQAFHLYRQAAQGGDPNAQCALGCIIWDPPDGMLRNEKEAIRWLKLAANQGHPQALRNLVICTKSAETDQQSKTMTGSTVAALSSFRIPRPCQPRDVASPPRQVRAPSPTLNASRTLERSLQRSRPLTPNASLRATRPAWK